MLRDKADDLARWISEDAIAREVTHRTRARLRNAIFDACRDNPARDRAFDTGPRFLDLEASIMGIKQVLNLAFRLEPVLPRKDR
ncbi:hypothetical protein [Paludisphaera mucosa]|uniref:Uncharacterized protein n=1 Tax=Paludisphaera mucosa TaxID=3030827 RepID=A0ABT6F5J9_9BACT|nr:hypothetical protein [Paludisphaera mucosa]MDG3002855.1 hypothetical protein [Paludisphaera mucosa]